MHPRILAAKELEASVRLSDAVSRLSEKLGMGHSVDVRGIRNRDGRIQTMQRFEAVADFMEDLEERLQVAGEAATEQEVVERVLALEGLTKTSAEKIREAFADVLTSDDSGEGENDAEAGESA